jgi:hypothetical protein
MGELLAVGMQHLLDAGDLRGSGSGPAGIAAGDQHVDFGIAQQRSGDGVQRGAFDAGVVVFGDDEGWHVR